MLFFKLLSNCNLTFTHVILELSARCVKRLYERGGMSYKQSVACRAGEHASNG